MSAPNLIDENLELNALVDRLSLALLQEQKASEKKDQTIQRLRAGIQSALVALEDPDNTTDTVWFNAHTTLAEHLQFLLDPGPQARGESPLVSEGA